MSQQPQPRIDRRQFLIGSTALGAGLQIGLCLAANRYDKPPASGTPFTPNAFLRIAPDDTITVIIGKSEMGQGIYTGLAMVVAEELDVDPRRVQVEFAPVDPAFNAPFAPVQFTGGSSSTNSTYMQLREAGACARSMLLAAAARRWQASAATLRTEDGRVFNGSKSLSYGALS